MANCRPRSGDRLRNVGKEHQSTHLEIRSILRSGGGEELSWSGRAARGLPLSACVRAGVRELCKRGSIFAGKNAGTHIIGDCGDIAADRNLPQLYAGNICDLDHAAVRHYGVHRRLPRHLLRLENRNLDLYRCESERVRG